MATHRFSPSHYHPTLGTHDPVLRIAEGDSVVTSTLCAHGYDAAGVQVTQMGNPMTGPFHVEGAEPGDALEVTIDSIVPNRDYGWARTIIAPNVLEPDFLDATQPVDVQALASWRVDNRAGTATLAQPTDTAIGSISLPLAPMIGCLGVAPALGQAISTATSGEHGGNMDYRGLAAGTTVYFPVFVPGALFHLGDCHALQGDGEIGGTGVEISCDVQFTVRIRRDSHAHWPGGEDQACIFTVGNARPLDQALQHATTEMLRRLRWEFGLDAAGARILMGQCVEYDVGNIFDPAYTMVCKIAKRVLKSAVS